MDSGFKDFILGGILVVPLIFLLLYLVKKTVLKSEGPSRSMMDDPWYSGSTWQRMRKTDQEIKKL